MVVRMVETIRCVNCKKIAERRNIHGIEFDNPLFQCKYCGSLNYDPNKLEAAFLSAKTIKNRYKEQSGLFIINYLGGISLFFGASFLFNTFLAGFIAIILVLVPINVLALRKRKKKIGIYVDERIQESLGRLLANQQYAQIVAKLQKIDLDSAWVKRGFCLNCGFKNGDGCKKCSKCGAMLSVTNSSVP